jgi:hypothetical protein
MPLRKRDDEIRRTPLESQAKIRLPNRSEKPSRNIVCGFLKSNRDRLVTIYEDILRGKRELPRARTMQKNYPDFENNLFFAGTPPKRYYEIFSSS